MATTTTAQNAKQQAAIKAQQQANRDFMELGIEIPIYANAQNGTNYVVGGNPMNFDVPIIPGAYVHKLTIRHNLDVNYTPAGTSPEANLTAAGETAAFSNVEVRFGNKQAEIHPYIARQLAKMAGSLAAPTGMEFGTQNADIQSQLYTSPTLASGANTWQYDVDIPLNLLHPMSVNGILPISGSGTRVQISLTPTAAFAVDGADPLQNCIDTNGTVAVSGTVQVIAWYRDWQSFATRNQLAPSLAGMSTVQVIKPQSIQPLTSGTMNFKRLTNPYPFVKFVSLVIDGLQSSKFSSASNIQAFEIDKAENTSSVFVKYDNTNGGMANYYKQIRQRYKQDFDEGVLCFDASTTNVANPSNLNGRAFLNLTPKGYPAARLGYTVGQVGTGSNGTPRVETWAVIINPMGIQAV